MRETRLSGSEGGAGSIPVPTPIVARAFQPVGLGRAVRSARRPSSAVSHPFSVLRPLRSLLSEILPCVPSIPWAAQRVTLRPAIRGRPDMGWKNPPPSDHSVPSCQKFFRVFRVFRGPTLRPPPSCICLPVIHPILAPFAPLRGQPSALCPVSFSALRSLRSLLSKILPCVPCIPWANPPPSAVLHLPSRHLGLPPFYALPFALPLQAAERRWMFSDKSTQ